MNAMLLERCFPGTSLNALTETEQDPIVAGILRRLWAKAPDRDRFRSLPQMVREWTSAPTGTPEPEYDECSAGSLLAWLRNRAFPTKTSHAISACPN
ncbi:MAG: hypothetical protein ACI8P2_004031 [Candidatus Latescibacterota bacterium]|jgi:hypothetical protein